MLEYLDTQTKLTKNQYKIIGAAILGDMLEFFDFFLIGFVLAIIIKPWHLTFGQSAIILLSSGVGAIMGAAFWGHVADRIGRKAVFMATVINFSVATGILAFTPDNGWLFLIVLSFSHRLWRWWAIFRRLAAGAGVRTKRKAWLYRWDDHLLGAGWHHAGLHHGSFFLAVRGLARIVCDRSCSGLPDVTDSGMGTGIAALAGPHGPGGRSPQIAGLGS